jgi:hypothetical protein
MLAGIEECNIAVRRRMPFRWLGKNVIRNNVEDRGATERLVEQAASNNNGAFP